MLSDQLVKFARLVKVLHLELARLVDIPSNLLLYGKYILDGAPVVEREQAARVLEVSSEEPLVALGLAAGVHLDLEFLVERIGEVANCGRKEKGVPDRHHRQQILVRV